MDDFELTEEDEILWETMLSTEYDPDFDADYWIEMGMKVVKELMYKMAPFEPAPEASEYAWW